MSSRRKFLLAAGTTTAALGFGFESTGIKPGQVAAAETSASALPVRFALNTSTIRGQDLTIVEQVKVAASAGYDGIEPWIRDIQKHVDSGGQLADLRKIIADSGLTVDSAIGFANWIVNDDKARAAGLDQARQDMALVRGIGGSRMAAPPVGAHRGDAVEIPLDVIGERYGDLLRLGDETGVVPQLELWGFSPTLSKLGELAYVATAAEHPKACVLPDFYHIYKGGNDFAGLGMIEASRMHCFHINDYPADPPLNTISDKDRVFPGDGVCPLPQIIRELLDHGFAGTFSLELFNPTYWERDALEVAQVGLTKSRKVVQEAMAL